MAKTKTYKPKKCKACGTLFQPFNSMQKVCGVSCANKFVQMENERKEEKKWNAYKKAWKDENKPYYELVKEAQKEFNVFIRERDKMDACICCGEWPKDQDIGGAWDCGHYRSTGSSPHLRFNEDNAHKQRKFCNRDRSGNIVSYRVRLIQKIGIDRVEAIESDNEPRKFTREELKEIKLKYRRKTRELRKKRDE